MRLFLLPSIPLSLSGCFGLDYFADNPKSDDTVFIESDADADADADTDTDTDADADTEPGTPPEIVGVDPSYGSTAGGTSVTIVGGPFDGGTTVTFGGATAAILSSTTGTLTVRTPSIAAEDSVDVEVTTSGGSDTQTDGFTYFEAGAGLTAAMGEVALVEYLGSYWTDAVPFGYVNWNLTVPTAFRYYDFFAPSADTCRSEYQPTGDLYVYDLDIPSTRLRSGSSTVTLTWDDTALSWSADLTSAQLAASTSVSVLPIEGGPLDGLTIDPLTTLPRAPTLSAPNLNSASLIALSQNQLSFSWSAPDADFIVLQLGLTNPAGDSFVEWVTCRVNNDGSFTVAPGTFNGWVSGRYVYVYFGAVKEGTATVDTNGGLARVAGMVYKLGAARTQ